MIYNCPCHGPEYRHDRFEYLDDLIRRGLGSMPTARIEEILRATGELPPPEPEPEEEIVEDEIAEIQRLHRAKEITAMQAVYRAVVAGCATSTEISARFGWSIGNTSRCLIQLERRGVLRVCDVAVFPRKTKSYELVPGADLSEVKETPVSDRLVMITEAVRMRAISLAEGVYQAVMDGHSTSAVIGTIFRIPSNKAAAILRQLALANRIRVAGSIAPKKSVFKIYVPVEKQEAISA